MASISSWLMTSESSWAEGLFGLKWSLFFLIIDLKILSSMKYHCRRAFEIILVSAHSRILCSSWVISLTFLSITSTIRCSTVQNYTQEFNFSIISFADSSTWIMDILILAWIFDIFSANSIRTPFHLVLGSMSDRTYCMADISFSSITIPFKPPTHAARMGAGTYGVCTCIVSLDFFLLAFQRDPLFLLFWMFILLIIWAKDFGQMNHLSVLIQIIFRRYIQFCLCDFWISLLRFKIPFSFGSILFQRFTFQGILHLSVRFHS